MAKKKLRKKTGKRSKGQIDQLAAPVIESAQDIWRAGLGALAMAQKEGGKVVGQGSALFEHLVAEGARFEKQGKAAVDEGAANVRGGISAMADDLEGKLEAARKQAEDRWENLESVFERRVLKVVQNLGLATADDLRRLADQVEQLSGHVAPKAGAAQSATGGKASKKTTSRKSSKKATSSKAGKKTTSSKAGKKTTSSKAGKKTASKKTTARKSTTRKTSARKPTSKKTASNKTASKKTTAKKTAARKTTARKTAGKKTTRSKTTKKST